MGRTVKLGRKMLVGPVAHHWAVKAGDTWYEVAGASKNDKGAKMVVNRYVGGTHIPSIKVGEQNPPYMLRIR